MDVSTVRKYYDEIRAELAGQEVQNGDLSRDRMLNQKKEDRGAGRDRHGACGDKEVVRFLIP